MFQFFTENNLIAPSQSGFRPGDSCINQLFSITYDIYKPFDEVHEVYLDISKAFDKVSQKFIIFKSKQYVISGTNLLEFLADFLKVRYVHGRFLSVLCTLTLCSVSRKRELN